MYSYNLSNLDRVLSGLRCYQDSKRVRQDVETVLRQIPSLQPTCGMLTYNNGTSSNLLYLAGTIPIFYNGNQYNIPVEMWLLEAYPYAPPKCYVRPTQDMMIKPGHPHVDREGSVILPYLSGWNANSHSLVELIAHQCSVFGDQPPVFRKPAEMPPSYAYTQPIQQQNPYQQTQQSYPNTSNSNSSYGQQPPPPVDPRKKAIADVTAKIQHELRKVFKRIREEMDSQFEMQVDLSDGYDKIENGIQSMKQLRQALLDQKVNIEHEETKLDNWLSERSNEEELDVDEILIPQDTWSQQMYDAFATQQAIEDALYFLDRALSNGAIDLNSFLKEVRKLSRMQFMKVALMKKVIEKQQLADRGLAPSYGTH